MRVMAWLKAASGLIGYALVMALVLTAPLNAAECEQHCRTGSFVTTGSFGSLSLTSKPGGGIVVASSGRNQPWGLINGDLILSANGHKLVVPEDAFAVARTVAAKQLLVMRVVRNGTEVTVEVDLARIQKLLPPTPPVPPGIYQDGVASTPPSPPATPFN